MTKKYIQPLLPYFEKWDKENKELVLRNYQLFAVKLGIVETVIAGLIILSLEGYALAKSLQINNTKESPLVQIADTNFQSVFIR